jgi:hypothetical protein
MRRLIQLLIITNMGAIMCLGVLITSVFIAARSDDDNDLVQEVESLPGAHHDCPDFPEPLYTKAEIDGNIITLLFGIRYTVDPAECFAPFPKEEGRFAAGWTKITVGDNEPIDVYDPPTIRDWDGNEILVGDIIDLTRMGEEFTNLWAEYEFDIDALSVQMHIEDLEGNSLTVSYGDCSKIDEENA